MKKITLLIIWLLSIIISIVWSYENPEKIERLKFYFKKNQKPDVNIITTNYKNFTANAFDLEIKKVISFDQKPAFIIYPIEDKIFKKEKLKIFTQNGYLIENLNSKKLILPSYFTLQRNGGVKTIISYNDYRIALISGRENECFFGSLVLTNTGKELARTKCLPEKGKNNDFNGLGSSNIHLNEFIFFTLGTPEKHLSKNSLLAQDSESLFGKIIRLNKSNLIESIENNKDLELDIFSKGHRVPQGLTKINNEIFSVEHGPKGGDELNRILERGNYGWPKVSYGTNYLKNDGGDGKSIDVNHETDNFIEPLIALVPSIGISSLNNCPKVLKNYYKKNCLLALSLYGNNLRKGNSIIVFLLNNEMTKVDSFEIIRLNNHVLRHFVTGKENELYEDENGNIYVSADKDGIYSVNFKNFR